MRWIITLMLMVFATTGAMAQDLADGERLYRRCQNCHGNGESEEHGLGPSLTSVFGRKAGSAEGYRYSPVVSAAGAAGIIWDAATLDRYLQDPRGFYGERHRCIATPDRRPASRQNLIAFLTDMPQIALANRLAREAEEANRRRQAELRAQQEALATYLAQLEKAREAIEMGAGPGSLKTEGYLQPRLLANVYEGNFDAAGDVEFPAEYLYRFAEVSDKQCDSPILRQALTSFGGNLLELGFDRGFQEEALSQTLNTLQQLTQDPAGLLATAARKEATMKAGIEDAVRFHARHQCETNSGIAQRLTHNLAAILSGRTPVYLDNPVDPQIAADSDDQ